MNHLAIIRVFSMLLLGLAGLMLISAGIALSVGDLLQVRIFFGTALAIAAIGGTVLFLSDRSTRRKSANDGLAVAVLFWIVLPIPAALPFLGNSGDLSFMTAYYDAVSSLTTTGHSLTASTDRPLPTSLLFWRAILHLGGAIGAITIAATILSALNLGGPGIHRTYLFTIREADFFDTMPRMARAATLLVIASALVLTSLLLMLGASPRQAGSWAVSAITTGLVDPTSATFNPAMTPVESILIFLGLCVGTIGFVAVEHLSRGRWGGLLSDPETLALAVTTIIVAIIVFLAGVPIVQSLGWSLSSLSTSGIALSDSDRFLRIPLPIVLLPVLIGGSALSAAGGVKLGRMLVLSRRVGLEFIQLGYRGSVQKFKFRGRYQSERTVMGVWVYLVGYVIASVLGVLIFSALGLPFDAAISTAIGSLSNSGHVIDGQILDATGFAQFCVILGMVLGRLEVIALLPALNPRFWRA